MVIGRQNEISVFVDLGGAVWFFMFVSHLCIFDAGRLPSEPVSTWRMGCDCAGNHRISYQYQHGTFLFAIHA